MQIEDFPALASPRRAFARALASLCVSAWVTASAAGSPPVGAPMGAVAGSPGWLEQVAAVGSLSQCINDAAQHHKVNPWVLAAILRRESRLDPNVVRTNSNGSVDVGIAGVNSVHFPELQRVGLTPSDLLNPCVSTYYAAWLLSKQQYRFGISWTAIGAYHSTTPLYNEQYQIAIWNELVDMGALPGQSKRSTRP